MLVLCDDQEQPGFMFYIQHAVFTIGGKIED